MLHGRYFEVVDEIHVGPLQVARNSERYARYHHQQCVQMVRDLEDMLEQQKELEVAWSEQVTVMEVSMIYTYITIH